MTVNSELEAALAEFGARSRSQTVHVPGAAEPFGSGAALVFDASAWNRRTAAAISIAARRQPERTGSITPSLISDSASSETGSESRTIPQPA